MSKSTNVFSRIFDIAVLIFITFIYMTTNSSILFGLVSTVLFGIIAYRQHYLVVALDALIVLLCVVIYNVSNVYVDLLYVIIDTLSLCFTGVISGIMLKNRQKHFSTIVAVSISGIIKMLLSLLSIKREGYDIFETLIENPVNLYTEYTSSILKQSGAYSNETIDVINDLMNSFVSGISTLMPAIIIIISVITSYFSYVVVKKMIEIITKEKLYVQSFSQLKMSRKASIALLVFVLLTFVIPQSIVSDAILNIVVIFLFAYFMCGLSVIDFYFRKTKLWWWIRLVIYVILITVISMFLGALPLVFILLAMIDSRRDIRHIDMPDIVVEIKDDENES
ncbi:MAG: DUF2232 domain-containing protein [Ruminococcaceae bacterium]|nr:DUF2232 domain-containing protein [Oscillospiraceae bacterium]